MLLAVICESQSAEALAYELASISYTVAQESAFWKALSLEWGRRVPTIHDVARRAGVSIATVSRVLNRSAHPVREAVRVRVEAAARELDFHPSSLARGLAGQSTRTLALVVPDIANPYYPRLSRGVEDVAAARGYALIVCNTDHSIDKLAMYLRLLREKRVDGILLAGGGHERPQQLAAGSRRALGELAEAGLPVQAIGRHPLEAPSVRIDNVAAARAATSHLLERGRKRVAFVGGTAGHTTVQDRRKGYRQALRAARQRPIASHEVLTSFSPADGEAAGGLLLQQSPPPDGVFAFNDYLAVGVIHALLQAGRRVPEDVAVIGFDDIPLASYFRPSLSSVAVPAYELGVAAAERLLCQLAGEDVSGVQWIETRIVARGSSGS
jgi:LacI family transcriptional regulator